LKLFDNPWFDLSSSMIDLSHDKRVFTEVLCHDSH
jgi:hypothetical protein